jgi:hypothetical protein
VYGHERERERVEGHGEVAGGKVTWGGG